MSTLDGDFHDRVRGGDDNEEAEPDQAGEAHRTTLSAVLGTFDQSRTRDLPTYVPCSHTGRVRARAK